MKTIYAIIMAAAVGSAMAITETQQATSWFDNNTLEQAFEAGDSRALAELYSEDAVVIPPSLEILETSEDIRRFWEKQITSGTGNFRLQTINSRQHGNVVYQSAVWIATKVSNGVESELFGEMTNVISQQADGSWKIQLQSWN